MKDKDITRIRKALRYKERYDLAGLLAFSTSNVKESTTYGKRLYAMLSTFEIYSPPEQNELLIGLSEQDKEEINKAVFDIFPLKDEEPEITSIEYFVDYDLESTSLVDVKYLDKMSFEYIREQINKCNYKIQEKDYEGAITNSRTLIESICLFILENVNKDNYKYEGNLINLYKDTAKVLNLLPGTFDNNNIKQLTSGLFSIINGVSGLRNSSSDSHGTSPSNENNRIDLKHAALIVNIAQSVSEYLYLSYEEINNFQSQKRNEQKLKSNY